MGIKRRTPSVDLLMKEFHNSNGAISVIELVNRLQMQINKTTIYRVLDKLEDDGVLHSFLDKNGSKCYAKCSDCSKHHHQDRHPHFQCIECGKMDCLQVDIHIPNVPNIKIITSQILLQGKCESCS